MAHLISGIYERQLVVCSAPDVLDKLRARDDHEPAVEIGDFKRSSFVLQDRELSHADGQAGGEAAAHLVVPLLCDLRAASQPLECTPV